MELREKIARLLPKVTVTVTGLGERTEFLNWDYHLADSILAIPEIKAALMLLDAQIDEAEITYSIISNTDRP